MAIARWTIGMLLLTGVAAAREAPALGSDQERQSYALGMAVGKQLRAQAVDVDPDLYFQGLKDALSGAKTLLTEAEGRAAIHRLHLDRKQRKSTRQRTEPAAATAAAAVQVSFKLDPRLTKGLYMGDRWASQATYSSMTSPDVEAITIEARARGAAAAGTVPSWIASNPEMVTISPAQGGAVKLTVRRAGESTVTVKVGDLSSTFTVKTAQHAESWSVDLSNVRPAPRPDGVAAAASAGGEQRR